MKEIQQKQPYGCGVYAVANALFIPGFITEERIEANKKGGSVHRLNKWLEEDGVEFRIETYFFDIENTDPLRLLTVFDKTVEDNSIFCAILQVKKTEKSRWHMVAAELKNDGTLLIKDSYKEENIQCSLNNILDYYHQVAGLFLFEVVNNPEEKAIIIRKEN